LSIVRGLKGRKSRWAEVESLFLRLSLTDDRASRCETV
jgi:hypothetical protein